MFLLKLAFLTLLVTGAPLLAAPPVPLGVLNSFEGQVWINGAQVQPPGAGRSTVEIGRVIRTGRGMAELLLTPGAFLRLGERSELTLVAVGTPDVHARLEHGEALLEILDVRQPVVVEQNGVTAVVRKPGLYGFDQAHAVMTVYAGEAQFGKDGRQTTAQAGSSVGARRLRSFPLNPAPGGSLFSWSSLRSEQLSAESAASAQAYPGPTGSWRGPGWYAVPWAGSYTFLSASGVVAGPFGWPYYSPGYTPNAIPMQPSGDAYPYGPPAMANPYRAQAPFVSPGPGPHPYTVPLTAPGVPGFPHNRR